MESDCSSSDCILLSLDESTNLVCLEQVRIRLSEVIGKKKEKNSRGTLSAGWKGTVELAAAEVDDTEYSPTGQFGSR